MQSINNETTSKERKREGRRGIKEQREEDSKVVH
jgi:hypothetical protein